MPHTSKKYRKQNAPSGNNRSTLVIVAVIIVVIAAVGGYYVYTSLLATSTSTFTTTASVSTGATSSTGNLSNLTTHCTTTSSIICGEIGTTYGTIYIELFASQTPKTVTNFVNLAKSGFYTNLVWHRIVKNFVIQTGDPNTKNGAGDQSTWGQGGSSQTVPLEIVSSLHNTAGYLGMARGSSVNSGSSQFYINVADNSASLDGNYTVFGNVLDGMNVALQISNVPVNSASVPTPLVYMTGVTIVNSY